MRWANIHSGLPQLPAQACPSCPGPLTKHQLSGHQPQDKARGANAVESTAKGAEGTQERQGARTQEQKTQQSPTLQSSTDAITWGWPWLPTKLDSAEGPGGLGGCGQCRH